MHWIDPTRKNFITYCQHTIKSPSKEMTTSIHGFNSFVNYYLAELRLNSNPGPTTNLV